jgi:hypothetical protein
LENSSIDEEKLIEAMKVKRNIQFFNAFKKALKNKNEIFWLN